MTVRALVASPDSPGTMRHATIPSPSPAPGRAVVEVRHVSLNHGDLNDAVSGRVPVGEVLGSDLSGTIAAAATDGTGPPVGARVVALAAGAFAERVAVDVTSMAELPEGVDPAHAAALPVAGLAALRTVRGSGSLLGRRVLVTGASGGVGSFALQLARAAGAHVIASIGHGHRAAGIEGLGAHEIVVGLDGLDRLEDPVDVVIDGVGGPHLVRAWELLAPGGIIHSVGWASGAPAEFPPYATVGPAKTLSSYLTEGPAATDLAALVALVREGSVSVRIGWRDDWERFEEATAALRGRRVDGKAILDL